MAYFNCRNYDNQLNYIGILHPSYGVGTVFLARIVWGCISYGVGGGVVHRPPARYYVLRMIDEAVFRCICRIATWGNVSYPIIVVSYCFIMVYCLNNKHLCLHYPGGLLSPSSFIGRCLISLNTLLSDNTYPLITVDGAYISYIAREFPTDLDCKIYTLDKGKGSFSTGNSADCFQVLKKHMEKSDAK